MPSAKSIPSTLYPKLPSIVLNASTVKLSIKSTVFLATTPKLKSFNPGLNSTIGLIALDF